jgi:MSHA biogenesis protein MshJ
MMQLWRQLAKRVDAMALRERILLLAVALVVLVLAVDALWLGPAGRTLNAEQGRLEQLREQRVTVQARLEDLARREAEDPEAELRARLRTVRDELGRLDEQLHDSTLRFVQPTRMAGVLEDLILGSEALTLVSMRSEPARPVTGPPQAEDLPVIYRHGLTMELRGEYLALVDYLHVVEAMPWGLFWEALEVHVQDSGPRRFVIRVFTLSLEEDSLGV